MMPRPWTSGWSKRLRNAAAVVSESAAAVETASRSEGQRKFPGSAREHGIVEGRAIHHGGLMSFGGGEDVFAGG